MEEQQPNRAYPAPQRREWNRQYAVRRRGLYVSTEETSLGPVYQTRQSRSTAVFSCHNGLILIELTLKYAAIADTLNVTQYVVAVGAPRLGGFFALSSALILL